MNRYTEWHDKIKDPFLFDKSNFWPKSLGIMLRWHYFYSLMLALPLVEFLLSSHLTSSGHWGVTVESTLGRVEDRLEGYASLTREDEKNILQNVTDELTETDVSAERKTILLPTAAPEECAQIRNYSWKVGYGWSKRGRKSLYSSGNREKETQSGWGSTRCCWCCWWSLPSLKVRKTRVQWYQPAFSYLFAWSWFWPTASQVLSCCGPPHPVQDCVDVFSMLLFSVNN